MKIAYIHQRKKSGTGAHFINDLIVSKLGEHTIEVQCFYPQFQLADTPINFRGIGNILFFYSLLEKRAKILKCDIIQGTTYTPLAFMQFDVPVVSHFGSTTFGFLTQVPKTSHIEKECRTILSHLRAIGVISEVDLKSHRPLQDIASIEQYAAQKASAIIATSECVRQDLIDMGINEDKITVIHNAIEDYWFDTVANDICQIPSLIFLGRIGEDPFTLKIKGFDRLIYLYEQFPLVPKISFVMSRSKKIIAWMREYFPHHRTESNILKHTIPKYLADQSGSILLITSRYEGFSLSLIEGMSQGLIPVVFRIGVAPEIIRNGENGYLVESIYEAVTCIQLILENHELRKKLSENARQTAEQFRSEILVMKMINLYEKIGKKK